MKKLLLVLLVCLGPSLVFASENPTDPAAYTTTVHVRASHTRYFYDGRLTYKWNRLETVIDGKNIELQTTANSVLALGDYKARIIPTAHVPKNAPPYDIYTTYEFLLPDGKTRQFALTGLEAHDSATATPQP